MTSPFFEHFMSQDDGNDSSLEKTIEELFAKPWPPPDHPDLPYRSMSNPLCAGNAESPGPSLDCPLQMNIDPNILHTDSQVEGHNFRSAQTDKTLPQPQQNIGTGGEPNDNAAPSREKDTRGLPIHAAVQQQIDELIDVGERRQYPIYLPVVGQTELHENTEPLSAGQDDNDDVGRKTIELKLQLVRLRLEKRRKDLGLSESTEDQELAENDEEYLKLLLKEIQLVKAVETINMFPSGRELAQRPPNFFGGPLDGPRQAIGKPVEFGRRSDASAADETSKATPATTPTPETLPTTSVDAEVVVPVGHQLNESARKSVTRATVTYQNRPADVITPREGTRTQIGPQPTMVRRTAQKRRLPQVDEAPMYDCVIDVVVKQDLVRSRRAKMSEDDKRRNEEVRSERGQCLRCRHFKLACSGGNPCVTCQKFFAAQRQRQLQKRQRVDPRFNVCTRTSLDSMNIFKYGIHVSASGSDHLKGYLHDIFEDSGAPLEYRLLGRLNTAFLDVIQREWTANTCTAKNALVARDSGWHVLIKANIVLEEAKLFDSLAEAIALLKGDFERLRALASVHAFAVLEEVMRPANLQNANLPKLIKVISFLASLYQQVLLVREHTSAPNGRGATTECISRYEMLQALDSAMLCLLRYLIARAFPTEPSLLHLLDETDSSRLLNQAFFQKFFAIMEDNSKLLNHGQNGARDHRKRPVQDSVQEIATYEEESMAHPLSDDSSKESHEAAKQVEAVEARLQHMAQPIKSESGDVEYVRTRPFTTKRQKIMNFGTKIATNLRGMMSPKSKRKHVQETTRDISTTNLWKPWWAPRATDVLPRLPVRSPDQIVLEQAGNCPKEFMATSCGSARSSLDVQNDWDETPLRHLEFNARVSSYR